MRLNDITREIIGGSMKVHSILGPGVLESAYHACLSHELRKRGLEVCERVQMPVVYEDVRLDVGL
jgi:GxxExxY protein